MRMIAALALLATALPAQAQRWTPDAGTRPYRLEIVEHIAGRADGGYRIDYDLVTDGKGGAVVVVRSADKLYSGRPTPPSAASTASGAAANARAAAYEGCARRRWTGKPRADGESAGRDGHRQAIRRQWRSWSSRNSCTASESATFDPH